MNLIHNALPCFDLDLACCAVDTNKNLSNVKESRIGRDERGVGTMQLQPMRIHLGCRTIFPPIALLQPSREQSGQERADSATADYPPEVHVTQCKRSASGSHGARRHHRELIGSATSRWMNSLSRPTRLVCAC